MNKSNSMKRHTLLAFILLAMFGCSIALDTESLIQPCQIDAECDDGYFCSSGACLPGERDDANLPDEMIFDGGTPRDAGM